MTDLYFQMAVALTLVIGMICLLGVAMKKKQGKEGLMTVLGYQSLGPKKGIAAVKIGQEVLLVGVTATDVKLLKSFDAPGEQEAPLTRPEKPTIAGITEKLNRLKAMKDTLYAAK